MPDLKITDVGGRRKWQQRCVEMSEPETDRKKRWTFAEVLQGSLAG